MVVIVRSLFNDLVRFSALNHAYLTKVAQEVGPHDVMLVDVCALNLRHRDEVICQ